MLELKLSGAVSLEVAGDLGPLFAASHGQGCVYFR